MLCTRHTLMTRMLYGLYHACVQVVRDVQRASARAEPDIQLISGVHAGGRYALPR